MMIQDYDIDAWVRDSGMTPEQAREYRALVARYVETVTPLRAGAPEDYDDEDRVALSTALDAVRGWLDLEHRGRAYRRARMGAQVGALVAVLSGMSELQAARESGVSREKIRALRGRGRPNRNPRP